MNCPDDEKSNIIGFPVPWTLTSFFGFLVIAMDPPYGAAITKLLALASLWKDSG